MYPKLPEVCGFALSTYALLAGLAMLAAVLPVRSEARRLGWNVEEMTWLVFTATAVGWIGAHVLFVLTQLGLPAAEFWQLVPNLGSGSVWYGGFIASWVFVHWHARRHGLEPLRMYDVIAFGTALAQAIGRIGCLMGGCCYGIPTELPWGVVIPRGDHGQTSVHPVPLYEALYLTMVLIGLWRGRAQRRPGYTVILYLVFSAVGRFALEFLRGDHIRGFVWGWLSTSQFVALMMLVVAALLWIAASGAAGTGFSLLRTDRRTLAPSATSGSGSPPVDLPR
jgi:phosphatidylglycerol---prolipoprotein diacylglyceryl transferase